MKVNVYWMENCPHCEKFKKNLKDLPPDFVKPTYIEHKNISNRDKERFSIKMYPTIVFLTNDDKIISIHDGYLPYDELFIKYKYMPKLEQLIKRKYTNVS